MKLEIKLFNVYMLVTLLAAFTLVGLVVTSYWPWDQGVDITDHNNVSESTERGAAQHGSIPVQILGLEAVLLICSFIVGYLIFVMLRRLRKARIHQDWLQVGNAELANRIRGLQDVQEVGAKVLAFCGEYLDTRIGSVAVMETSADDREQLRIVARFGHLAPAADHDVFLPGQGLSGQAVLEKRLIVTNQVPTQYMAVSSTLGQALPSALVSVPLIHRKNPVGVMELGAFTEFNVCQLEFLHQASQIISGEIEASLAHQKVTDLLEQTQQQTHELERVSKYKSQFLANMSHEIRTPMNGVLGMTQLLLETDMTDEQQDYLNTVNESADGLLRLINDILDFSKIEAGKLELESIEFSVEEYVYSTLVMINTQVQNDDLDIIFDCPADLPQTVMGDPERLRQVLYNFLGNALKFTERGEIVTQIRKVRHEDGHNLLRFEISDTGIGIPEHKLDQIFMAFEQADGSTTRKHGGTGLGLAISAQLIEMMGGEVGITSTEGEGSVIWFTVRFADTGSAKPDIPGLKKQTAQVPVLVAMGNTTRRNILARTFSAWGMQVTPVADIEGVARALGAISKNQDEKPLLVFDACLRRIATLDALEQIKDAVEDAGARVVVLLRPGDHAIRRECNELGFTAQVTKPVKPSQLMGAVRTVLSGCSTEPDTRENTRRAQAKPVADTEQRRVLLAEDNPVNQRIVVGILNKNGHDVVVANDGAEALEQLDRDGFFDVVLMDVQMPRMSGLEATRRIRETEADTGHHLPIIALTAHALKEDRDRCLEAGMDEYITKPINKKLLLRKITEITANDAVPLGSD